MPMSSQGAAPRLQRLLGKKYAKTILKASVAAVGTSNAPIYTDAVIRALEAVLPDLLTDSWEDGKATLLADLSRKNVELVDHGGWTEVVGETTPNPYRSE